jgi:transcriptional regulator with XRE-family HTH domain
VIPLHFRGHAHVTAKKINSARGRRIDRAIKLRQWRKLSALAAAVEVNESAVTRWRQGGAISLDSAVRLSETLDVSLDWLAMGRATPDQHRAVAFDGEMMRLVLLLQSRSTEITRTLADFLSIALPPL